MEIRLYGENDSRPFGSYTRFKTATLSDSTVQMKMEDGSRVITNLRYKAYIAPEDQVLRTTDSFVEIENIAKTTRKWKAKKKSEQKAKDSGELPFETK